MGFLLDTNVISETSRARPSGAVLAWLAAVPVSSLRLSVLSAGEVRKGVEQIRARDPERAARIELWLDDVVDAFGPRLVPVDAEIAERWGRLVADLGGRPIATIDLLLAATALVHGWTVVTRNVQHFEPTGVTLLNPFDAR